MKRSLRMLAAVAVFAIVAAACAGGGAGGALKIGTDLPQTGDLAVLGPPMVEAVNMAVRDINDGGGVNGADVELVIGDSGTNEQVAAETADRLISSDQVDGIIGPASSRITLSVIDKITSAGIPMCSPSNTGSSLTTYESDVPGFYFRTAPPDNLQGPALADVILADGRQNVAVMALNDEYGQGFAGFLKAALIEGGASIAVDVAYDPNGTDFSADVQQVVDAAPDSVVLISFPDTGNRILTGLIENGLSPDTMYTADGMQSGEVVSAFSDDPSVLNGMKGTAPSAGGSQAFSDAFAAFAPGVATIFSAHAYDCVIIMALAAESAGSTEPADIAAAMVGVTQDGSKCDTYASCKTLIDDGEDIDYDGASGPGEWVAQGEPAAGTYDVWEFRDGEVNTLDTVDVG
ncbi:MAG: ABC transporter substrate-binding protein [Acidimicrobiia bacterium]|nr:ABC transporter substrate-binding protein [Acidimicrobiia bacterium]